MEPCPACGAEAVSPVADQYAVEVRRPDADPETCARLAPPTRRASIHGFILGTLVWISFLVPFFVVNHFWRATGSIWALTLLWVPLFQHARNQDRKLLAAYQARRRCAACGHEA